MKRGQISVEYVMLIGIILVVTIPLFYYGLSKSREDIRNQQASDTVYSLGRAADEVYSLGLGSRDYVWVNMPSGVNDVIIEGNNLIINLSIYGKSSEFSFGGKANLTLAPDFTEKLVLPGTHKISVETYYNTSAKSVMVLLGGSCGDEICSSVENAAICSGDCENICGDGVCNYPGTEACLIDYCSDCIDSQADCDAGKICAEDGSGQGVCVQGAGYCGDGYCYNEPYGENCNTCVDDCEPQQGDQCCFDAVTGTYYRSPDCGIPPSVTSCPDWCEYIGFKVGSNYFSGVCTQNPTKCDDFTGQGDHVNIDETDINEDGDTGAHPDCDDPNGDVDNECDGDEFCFAGAQSNTCCCIL